MTDFNFNGIDDRLGIPQDFTCNPLLKNPLLPVKQLSLYRIQYPSVERNKNHLLDCVQ